MNVDPKVKLRGPFYQWSDDERVAEAVEVLAPESIFLRYFTWHKTDGASPPQCEGRP